MFEHLKKLLRDNREPATSPEEEQLLASAVLLLEVARADYEKQPAEFAVLRTALARDFGIAEDALDGLLEKAELRAKQSVSLYEFVQTLNKSMAPEAKRGLLKRLWEVAHADGRVDPQEEALLRRIADLLYLSHADFIRGKLEAEKPNAK